MEGEGGGLWGDRGLVLSWPGSPFEFFRNILCNICFSSSRLNPFQSLQGERTNDHFSQDPDGLPTDPGEGRHCSPIPSPAKPPLPAAWPFPQGTLGARPQRLEGGLRARDTISFYPLATAPTLSLVADRGCFANKVSWKLSASLPLTSPREGVGGGTSD